MVWQTRTCHRAALLTILFASSSILGAEAAKEVESTAVNDGIKMTVTCPATMRTKAESILKFVVRNESDEPIQYTTYNDLNDADIHVTHAGKDVDSTHLYKSWTTRGVIDIRLAPTKLQKGQEMTATINLMRLFDLSAVGDYEVTVTWNAKRPVSGKPATVSATVKTSVAAAATQPATAPH